ncbi:hypothetical protein TELCIR_08610, partial [Teladorsagia circumcincta]
MEEREHMKEETRNMFKNLRGIEEKFTSLAYENNVYLQSSPVVAPSRKFRVAQDTVKCYLKGVNYKLVTVNLENDERTKKLCYKYYDYLFRRHCIAAEYLKDTDWMLVLDADTAVINPNHCIEEWIDDRVDVILYERFFNYEISAATFMFHVLDIVLPGAIQARQNCYDVWYNATSYETYMASVSCVKQALGATRLWPGQIRIYRKAHGWARDGFLTAGKWHDGDFMFHGWKGNHVKDDQWGAPFTEMPNLSLCGHNKDGWHWDEKMHVNVSVI